MNELHLLEFMVFAAGWFGKGLFLGVMSQALFQPLSRLIWGTLQRRALSQGYIAHHVYRHAIFPYKSCDLCHPTPMSETLSK